MKRMYAVITTALAPIKFHQRTFFVFFSSFEVVLYGQFIKAVCYLNAQKNIAAVSVTCITGFPIKRKQ